MTDLDYAKVIGRFGLTVGDTGTDPDDDPDTVWCTEGRVIITPLNTFVKVAGGSPVPWTGGNAQIECAIDANGYLTYTPPGGTTKQFVEVVDLTSSKVNPQITTGATHRVTFADVKSGTTPVAFPTFTCRLTAAGDGVSGAGINDLTIVAPIVPGEALPITRGPQGVSIESLAVNGLGQLEVDLDDGTTVNAGALPVGPGGSDAGVAGYLATPASASRAALDDATADLLNDPTSAVAIKTSASYVRSTAAPSVDLTAFGEFYPEAHGALADGTTDDTAAINAALTAASAAGGGRVVLKPGATYAVTGQILAKNLANIGIVARGATVKSSYAGTILQFNSCSRVHVIGGYFYSTNTGARQAGWDGIQLLNCVDFEVDSVKVGYVRSIGIRVNGSRRGIVRNCYVNGTLADGIGCYYGARASGANASLTGTTLVCPDGEVKLSQNDVGAWVTVPGAGVGGATLLTQIVSVASQTQATVATAATANVTNVAIFVNYICDQVQVVNNRVVSSGDDSYSVVGYKTVAGSVTWAAPHTNIVIADNVSLTSGARGVVVVGCDRFIVSGNVIDTPTKSGIDARVDTASPASLSTKNGVIANNVIYNPNAAAASAGSISLQSASSTYTVENVVVDGNTITGGSTFIYAGDASITTAVTRIVITNNTCVSASPLAGMGIQTQNVTDAKIDHNRVNGAYLAGISATGGHPLTIIGNTVQNTNVGNAGYASIVSAVGNSIVIGNHADENRAGANIDLTNAPTSQIFGNYTGFGQTVYQGSITTPVLSAKVGSIPTSATAGSNGAPPSQVVGYTVVILNGTAYKVPLYAI